MQQLTDEQIERQDFVDNAIFELIQNLVPYNNGTIEWDIEMIGDVRDTIETWLVNNKNVFGSTDEFYP